jgi:hypothetical protein
MAMMRPKPRVRSLTYRQIAAGCVQVMRDLERGKLRHFNQAGMNEAAGRAAKRKVRDDESGAWLWGKTASGGDITTIVAGTKALANWDLYYSKKPTGNLIIMGD